MNSGYHAPDAESDCVANRLTPSHPVRPERPGMTLISRLRQKYARVITVVGATARMRHGIRQQGLTLADVAQDILTFRDFSMLCREDMRDAWINDSERRTPRTTGNRVDTWERLYAHWYARRGTSGEPPAIRVRAQDRQGTYTVEPAEERRSEERLWSDFMRKTRALHIPQHLSDAFRRATEHYYCEWQAAQAAQAAHAATAAQEKAAATPPTPQDQPQALPPAPAQIKARRKKKLDSPARPQ